MARINIEECWWSDPRRMKLIELIGTLGADGVAINAWRTAQEFWAKGELVPLSIWKHVQANDKLIQANLAEERDGGVYVRGSSQYLEWVAERRRAAAAGGKKSAKKRAKKPQTPQANGKQTQAKDELAKQTQPSGSSSSSGSSSDSCSGSEELHPPVAAGSTKELRDEIWKRYSNAYFSRYKTEPVRNAVVNSKIKLLAERLGDEAKDVVEFYVTHNNAFYVRSTHQIGLCLQDAEGLRTQWATGRMTSQKEAQQADSSTALASQLKRLREEAL